MHIVLENSIVWERTRNQRQPPISLSRLLGEGPGKLSSLAFLLGWFPDELSNCRDISRRVEGSMREEPGCFFLAPAQGWAVAANLQDCSSYHIANDFCSVGFANSISSPCIFRHGNISISFDLACTCVHKLFHTVSSFELSEVNSLCYWNKSICCSLNHHGWLRWSESPHLL